MANKATRAARTAAHAAFDPLWRYKLQCNPRMRRNRARSAAYAWLARELGIPVERCHISLFGVPQCMRVVEVCAALWRDIQAKREGQLTDPSSPPSSPP